MSLKTASDRPEEILYQRRRNERDLDRRLRSSRRTIVAIIQVTGASGGSELNLICSCKLQGLGCHLQRMIHNYSVGTVSYHRGPG
jgi:hypothetical protein